jgi:hypothetical protein
MACWPQHVKGFHEDGDCRGERFLDSLQGGLAPQALTIARIEQRDERTGIDQDHRLSFRRIDS